MPDTRRCLYRRGTIYHMLANRIYRGDIVHKGEAYPGEHEPIVSDELWDEVQRALTNRSQGGSTRQAARWPIVLHCPVVKIKARTCAAADPASIDAGGSATSAR